MLVWFLESFMLIMLIRLLMLFLMKEGDEEGDDDDDDDEDLRNLVSRFHLPCQANPDDGRTLR